MIINSFQVLFVSEFKVFYWSEKKIISKIQVISFEIVE